MSAMGMSVPIIAQHNAVQTLAQAAKPDLPAPAFTYEEFKSFTLGDRVIELHYLGANHSGNSTIVYMLDVQVRPACRKHRKTVLYFLGHLPRRRIRGECRTGESH